MSTWKDVERRLAKRAGVTRTGATGENTPDFILEPVAFELKYRATLPKWMLEAEKRLVSESKGETIPWLLLHAEGRRFVLCLYDDLIHYMREGVRPPICIDEVRRRKMGFFRDHMAQAETNADERGYIGVLVYARRNGRHPIVIAPFTGGQDIFVLLRSKCVVCGRPARVDPALGYALCEGSKGYYPGLGSPFFCRVEDVGEDIATLRMSLKRETPLRPWEEGARCVLSVADDAAMRQIAMVHLVTQGEEAVRQLAALWTICRKNGYTGPQRLESLHKWLTSITRR